MCEDCGCMEGNERAYAEMAEHPHPHPHGHSHSYVVEKKEIHIHIHLDGAADVHVHPHAEAGSLPHQHPHPHSHDHEHIHNGAAHTHPHTHDHDHAHAHSHDHAHGDAHGNHHHSDGEHAHSHGGNAGHLHTHEHAHDHEPLPSELRRSRTIAVETNVLAGNDAQAQKNREWLKDKGVVAVNLISSPGSGKTLLLEKTLEALRGEIQCAVITGDMQTDNDAQRMMGKGAKVVQIETRSACHLDARQVEEQLVDIVAGGVKLLFIENVGNLVCPAAFDLGEQEKIALVSLAEGEDKPVKYPVLFHGAGVTLITKIDLAPYLDVNIEKYKESVKKVQPGARIIEVSAKTGAGMDNWLNYLRQILV